MLNLEATSADYNELFRQMPAAQERLKIIILTRMVNEKDARLAELRNDEKGVAEKEVGTAEMSTAQRPQ